MIVGIHKEFLMKQLSQRGVLLFGAMLAVCAFVGPSMASAASWNVAGTHQLLSPNFSLAGGAPNFIGASCTQSTFNTTITNGADGAVVGSRFVNCRGTGGAAFSCTATATGQRFPWTATATATDNIQIQNVHMNVAFEALPGTAAAECLVFGLQITLTGTLTGGSWNPFSREITLAAESGLTAHPNNAAASFDVTVAGTIRDINQTLGVMM
ncbi:MAG TPA: hypothetical protein VFY45_12005 [Baekduia sp.]|nr:hypothetical protein [Baekduia sp.]